MAATATFVHGDPVMIDHTPGANVTAGDIILVGNTTGWTCGVAHVDIPANTLGAISNGGGVYLVKILANYAKGTKVYWDAANSVITSTSTNMSQFGEMAEASTAANTAFRVYHNPHA